MNKNLNLAGQAVAEFLKGRTGKEYDCFIKKVEKNNQALDTIVVMEKGSSVGVNLYPDVKKLKSDFNKTVKGLCVAALDAFESNFASIAKNVAQDFKSRDLAKYPITLRFYQKETNTFVKDQYLYEEISNLFLVPTIVLANEDNETTGYINITPDVSKALHLCKEEIFRRGITYLQDNANILDVTSFMCGQVKDYLHEDVGEKPFLVSVGDKTMQDKYAAPAILSGKIQNRLQEIFPEGYYVLPSSVHEMLCVSKTNNDLDTVKSIVSEVNNTQVEEKDLLATAVYEIVDGILKQIA